MNGRTLALRIAAAALSAFLIAACGDDDGGGGGGRANLQPGQGQCVVTFSMVRGAGVQNLSATVNIEGAAATPVITRVNRLVECVNVIGRGSATLSVPTYCDDSGGTSSCEKRLALSLVLDPAVVLDAPEDFMRCLFEPDSAREVDADGFVITVEDASDESLHTIDPGTLEFAVTDVACESVTVTSSTSTTMPGCVDVPCEPDEACVDGDCVATDLYEIAFRLVDETDVGALQYDTLYDAAIGSFVGVGADVDCEGNAELNAHTLYNHVLSPELPVGARRTNRLVFSHVALGGFRGPVRLGECRFRSDAGAPESTAFRIDVVDASSPDLAPLRVEVAVETIRPLAPLAPEP